MSATIMAAIDSGDHRIVVEIIGQGQILGIWFSFFPFVFFSLYWFDDFDILFIIVVRAGQRLSFAAY